jgi:hypothetical protein
VKGENRKEDIKIELKTRKKLGKINNEKGKGGEQKARRKECETKEKNKKR